ncbi:MAG TPA: type 1 glutamine amidotransferase [Solirubrobacteraceae bacterium]|nr:type 1 glutamine amidotransferase [Solirubrobacteraceae bacterium]
MRVLALVNHEVAGPGVFADEVRRQGHDLETWAPASEPLPRPPADYGAVIAFGGGMQVDQEDRHPWLREAFGVLQAAVEHAVPTLGVCLGAQMLARATGGAVGPAAEAECGWRPIQLTEAADDDPLFAGQPRVFEVFQWHSYACELPPGAVALARNDVCLQSFRVGPCAWGVQWHPEVTGGSVAVWARRHRPAPGGVPVPIDLARLDMTISERMDATNADGRALCARFLATAQDA